MLPRPRAAILGASAATRKKGALTFGGEQPVEGRHVEFPGRPEPGHPRVVDQYIHSGGLPGQIVKLGRIAEVGGDESGLATRRGDVVDDRRPAAGVPPVHDDFGAMPGQLFGRCPADA